MIIDNKFKIGQRVFIFREGTIYCCKIIGINVRVDTKITCEYAITPYDNHLSNTTFVIDEDNITDDIKKILDIIPVR